MFRLIANSIAALAASILLYSSTANAGLILEQYSSGTATPTSIGGYTMTDIDISNATAGTPLSSMASPISGTLEFQKKDGTSLGMTHRLADSTSWWVNGESNDYDIFTTGVSWIKILLPENTRAFSFNVGADLSSTGTNAWMTASESNGNNLSKHWFNVNRSNTPGFGIYADNSQGQCSAITSVIIDPEFWGVGNFSINQDSCSTTVPEPETLFLMGIGLAGLLLSRRNKKS